MFEKVDNALNEHGGAQATRKGNDELGREPEAYEAGHRPNDEESGSESCTVRIMITPRKTAKELPKNQTADRENGDNTKEDKRPHGGLGLIFRRDELGLNTRYHNYQI